MKGKTGKIARHGRRLLSVFLSVLMLMSAWAIVSPDMFPKAEAATAGNYYIQFNAQIKFSSSWRCSKLNNTFEGGWDGDTNDSAGVVVRYKSNNGTGNQADQTVDLHGWFDNTSNTSWTSKSTSVTVPGFPIGFYICLNQNDFGVGGGTTYLKMTSIKIGPDSSNLTEIWTGSTELASTNQTKKQTISKSWDDPYANSMSSGAAISGASSLTIPKTGASDLTSNYTNSGTVKDQYGVDWYQDLVYYLASSEPQSVDDVSDSFSSSKASIGGTGTLTLKSACQIAGTTNSVDAWVCAKRGNAWLKKKVTFNDPQYTVTFQNATGGTAKTQNVYYGCAATAPSNPAKDSDATNHYTFSSWDTAFNNVTTDLTVKPTYTSAAHTPSGWKTDANQHWKQCTVCSYITTAKANHSYGSWSTDTATCTSGGSHYRDCTTCSYRQTASTSALGHNPTKIAAVAATCTTAGNNEYYKCTRCNKYFTTQACTTETTVAAQTIAALGHDFTGAYQNVSDGKHNRKCSRCNEYGMNGTVGATENCSGGTANCVDKAVCTKCTTAYGNIDPSNHKSTENRAAVAATCETAGLNAGTYCTACSTWVTGGTTIPALGHNYAGEYRALSDNKHDRLCTKGCGTYGIGSTKGGSEDCTAASAWSKDASGHWKTCAHCTNIVVAKADHNKSGWVVTDGTKHWKTCTTCSYSPLDEANHNWQWVTDQAATCTAKGKKHEECTICHKTRNENTEIDMIEHTWVETVDEDHLVSAANCVDKAVYHKYCSVCGANHPTDTFEAGAVNANNHKTTENRAAVDATCTAGGYTAGVYCTACSKWVSGHEAVSAKGHD